MYTNRTDFNAHKTDDISYSVDSGISAIIMVISMNYSLDVTPIASCQGSIPSTNEDGIPSNQEGSHDAYILFHVRNLRSFDDMITEIFGHPDNVHIRYFIEDISRTFRVSWEPEKSEEYNSACLEWLKFHFNENPLITSKELKTSHD